MSEIEAKIGEATVESAEVLVGIVAVGASAGGLEALEHFFRSLPTDSGYAFVVIQHLSPDFKSFMDELLGRHTAMSIKVAENECRIEANTVYLIPPKKMMIVSERQLLLTDQDEGLHLPIDIFMRSLAQNEGNKAIGVILSGTGSDGSFGVEAIKEAGGLAFVQKPESAGFDGMPRSALRHVEADGVATPGDLPKLIFGMAGERSKLPVEPVPEENAIDRAFKILQEHSGIDFSLYKPATIERRIERRLEMAGKSDVVSYLDSLRDDPAEVDLLYKDLLIGVTSFFRDPIAFQNLKDHGLKEIFENTPPEEEVRIWVCGCATGEEAYTIAILAREVASDLKAPHSIRIFATDVHRVSLEIAGAGRYPETSLKQIPDEYRTRYFSQDGDYFKVLPSIRQLVVFSQQNVIKDPPFTRLHLISCRNMLIYFKENAQKHVIGLFHFALVKKGMLFMGNSEALNYLNNEFEACDHNSRMFRKKRDGVISPQLRNPLRMQPILPRRGGLPSQLLPTTTAASPIDKRILQAYDAALVKFMPPGILVNSQRELLHVFGDAARYFRMVTGRPSTDVLSMFDGDMKVAVTASLQKSIREKSVVAYRNIRHLASDGKTEEKVHLEVAPLLFDEAGLPSCCLVNFRSATEDVAVDNVEPTSFDSDSVSHERINELEHELQYTREHLQATIEELETSNEELQAANEEMLASNEELQSTNEELHSVNEELYTVNSEYERKNTELTELNTDIDNLLLSTGFGTLFVDKRLCIRKFTPAMMESFRLMPQDVGRPVGHISHLFEESIDLLDSIRQVISTRKPIEHRMTGDSDKERLLRISPYYAANNEVEGAVITDVNLTSLNAPQQERDVDE